MIGQVVTIVLFVLLVAQASAQNKNTMFYDSSGNVTSWENHWAQVVTGRYRSQYNKQENTKTLVRNTVKEFQKELSKTESRIKRPVEPGTVFPDFDVVDIEGIRLAKSQLKGRVLVINFWFIGCAPCEMERPVLNKLVSKYRDNEDVVFIAFAQNSREDLSKFLREHEVLYDIIPTEKSFIRTVFSINAFPVNIVVDRQGNIFFYGSGSGVGISAILETQIQSALNR